MAKTDLIPPHEFPYLLESRWQIKSLNLSKSLLTIQAKGYGRGDMRWRVPESGNYLVAAAVSGKDNIPPFKQQVTSSADGIVQFSVDESLAALPVTITLRKNE
jgi:hypothetical protein